MSKHTRLSILILALFTAVSFADLLPMGGGGGGGGGGTVTNVATTAPLTGGPITTTGTIACATCTTSAAALTLNQLIVGGGGQAEAALGSLGTTTTVLHGNAAGLPSFAGVSLANDTTANQGTTTTVLHGNAAGQPSFTAVVDGDVSGQFGVPHGGSGAGTFTAHGVLLGEGASAFGVTAVGATDTVLMGTTGADPSFAALTSCSAATSAVTYNTSTHAFGCNTISAAPGGASGDIQKNNGAGGFAASGLNDNGSGALQVYPNSATPQAATLTFAGARGGTDTNVAGVTTTYNGSDSTGTGLGGGFTFKVANLGTTGTAANTLGNVLTLSPPNTGTTAPVNYLDIKNALTGGNPTITSTGSDAAVSMDLITKSNANINLKNGGGTVIIRADGVNGNTVVFGSTTASFGFASGSASGAADTLITRMAANQFQFGGGNSATPSNQILQAQGSRGGTDTNVAGATMALSGGLGTGNSVPGILRLQGGAISATSGTTVQPGIDRQVLGASKVLTNNTVTTVTNVTDANNTSAAGWLAYSCEVFNGTDVQIEQGSVSYIINNKAGVQSGNTTVKYGNQQAATTGTIAVTWTITAANPALLQVNCNSSLTPNAGFPRLTYELHNSTQQAVAIQ